MSNKKSIMRALVLCGLAMLMSISMLAGTTFAWFTDSVESGNNKIVACAPGTAMVKVRDPQSNKSITFKVTVLDEEAV